MKSGFRASLRQIFLPGLLFLCFVYSGYGQSCISDGNGNDYSFAHPINGNDWVEGKATAVDADGNTYIMGDFQAFLEIDGQQYNPPFSSVDDNIFVAKYDPEGTLLWLWVSDGGSTYSGGIAVTPDNVYITGSYSNTPSFPEEPVFPAPSAGNSVGLGNNGGKDVFVAKLRADDGFLEWVEHDGDTEDETSEGIALDGDENVFITGSFYNKTVLGGSAYSSQGDDDIFVASWDNGGGFRWAAVAGGKYSDIGRAISFSEKRVFVTGYFTDEAYFDPVNFDPAFTLSSYQARDIFVGAYAADGSIEQVQWAGSDNDDEGLGISATDGVTAYLTGVIRSDANFGSHSVPSPTGEDFFVCRYNFDSNDFDWVRGSDGGNSSSGRGIFALPDYIYITGGYIEALDAGGKSISAQGGSDVFIAEFDGEGNLSWLRSGGGESEDAGEAIAADMAGNCSVTGYFNESADFGNINILSGPVSMPKNAFFIRPCRDCYNAINVSLPRVNLTSPVDFAVLSQVPGSTLSWQVVNGSVSSISVQVIPQVINAATGLAMPDWGNAVVQNYSSTTSQAPLSQFIASPPGTEANYYWRVGYTTTGNPLKWSDMQLFQLGVPGKALPATYLDAGNVASATHSNRINWVYEVTYSDNTTHESISYIDGLGNVRQQQAKSNTTLAILCTEVAYSEEGGGQVQSLAAPTGLTQFRYATRFFDVAVTDQTTNTTTYSDFRTEHFDRVTGASGTTLMTPVPVDASVGVGKYYSNNNTDELYVDDAGGYPYVYSVAEASPLARPWKMGGAGPTHKITGGRETTVDIVDISTTELQRVFGKTQAAQMTNITKTKITDPNGVISYSYQDDAGQVIATALGGCSSVPLNQSLLSDEHGFGQMDFVYDILKNDVLNTEDLDKESSSTFDVSCTNTDVTINYEIDQGVFTTGGGVCTDCQYDLNIKLINKGTGQVLLDEDRTLPAQPIAPNCSTTTKYTLPLTVNNLGPGTYEVKRVLRPHTDPATGNSVIDNAVAGDLNSTNLQVLKDQFEDQYYTRDEWYVLRQTRTEPRAIPQGSSSCPEVRPQAQVTFDNNLIKKLNITPNSITGKDAVIRIDSNHPTSPSTVTNFGDDIVIAATHAVNFAPNYEWNGSGNEFNRGHALFQFDLSSVPSTAVILDAKLSFYEASLYLNDSDHENKGGVGPKLQRITRPWDEMTITWEEFYNNPSYTNPVTNQNEVQLLAPTSVSQDYPNINVTAIIDDMIKNPSTSYGFILSYDENTVAGTDQQLRFASSDYPVASKRPKLDVLYADPTCSNLTTQSNYATATLSIVPPPNVNAAPIAINSTVTWTAGMSPEAFASAVANAINTSGTGFTATNLVGNLSSATVFLTAPQGTGKLYNNWRLDVQVQLDPNIGASCFSLEQKDVQVFTGGADAGICYDEIPYLDLVTMDDNATQALPNQRKFTDLDGVNVSQPLLREELNVQNIGTATTATAGERFTFKDTYERMHWVSLKDADISLMEVYKPASPAGIPLMKFDRELLQNTAGYSIIHVRYKLKCEDKCDPKEFPSNAANCTSTCDQQKAALEAQRDQALADVNAHNYALTYSHYNGTTISGHADEDLDIGVVATAKPSNLEDLISYLTGDSLSWEQKEDLWLLLEKYDSAGAVLAEAYIRAEEAAADFDMSRCVTLCNNGIPGPAEICESCITDFANSRFEVMAELVEGHGYLIDRWDTDGDGTPDQFPYSSASDIDQAERDTLGNLLANYLESHLGNTQFNFSTWTQTGIPSGSLFSFNDFLAEHVATYGCTSGETNLPTHTFSNFPTILLPLLNNEIERAGGIRDQYHDCLAKANDPARFYCEQNVQNCNNNRQNCIDQLDPASPTYQQDLLDCQNTFNCNIDCNDPAVQGDGPQRLSLIRGAVSAVYTDPAVVQAKVDELVTTTRHLTLAELLSLLMDFELTEKCRQECRQSFEDAFNKWYQDHIRNLASTTTANFVSECYNRNEKLSVSFRGQATHHYTLYNYNAAGKLVSTVPPEGVDYVDIENSDPAKSDRTPTHRMLTEYTTNSLGQLVSTKTPDAGETLYLYDKAGRLVFSQNKEQRTRGTATGKLIFSYTRYKPETGQIYEVGECINITHDPSQTTYSASVLKGVFRPANDTSTPNIYLSDKVDVSHAWPAAAYVSATDKVSYEYDEPILIPISSTLQAAGYVQKHTSQRVARAVGNGINTYFSYDVHGRITFVVQNRPGETSTQQNKTVDYEYLPVSGQVQKVYFQKNDTYERFGQRYNFDADSRLQAVEVTRDNVNWAPAAEYGYYTHGALKYKGLGDKVQKMDYVYNVQGWLKAINHTLTSHDPGQDSPGGNGYGTDVFGQVLHYYHGDYARSNTQLTATASITPQAGTALKDKGKDLFNGNISAVTSYTAFDRTGSNLTAPLLAQGFSYDVLNRLTGSYTDTQMIAGFSGWNNLQGTTGYYQENLTYDANGNIESLIRTGQRTISKGSNWNMDNLTYYYSNSPDPNYSGANRKNNNKLAYIKDRDGVQYGTDLDDQVSGNYAYDDKGRLIQDLKNEIATITWTAYDKVKAITRTAGSNKASLSFTYDAFGRRASKTVTRPTKTETYLYYYDAGGNLLSVTRKETATATNYVVDEQYIYGMGRVGTYDSENRVSGTTTTVGVQITTLVLGKLQFELADHLGNVRAVVSGQKQANGQADILMLTDYYAFGSVMPGRQFAGNGGGYRHGYQGQYSEKDEEFNSFDLRLYDSRIGRWISKDPYSQYHSPYVGMGNNPVAMVDPDGGFSVGGGPDIPIKNPRYADPSGSWNNARTRWRTPGNSDGGGRFLQSLKGFGEKVNNVLGTVTNVTSFASSFSLSIATSAQKMNNLVTHQDDPTIKRKNSNDDPLKVLSTVNGYLSLQASAFESFSGGLEEAMHLIEKGEFKVDYNGKTRIWKLKFNGNQYVNAEFVELAKTNYIGKASIYKGVKATGLVLNIVGLAITGTDMVVNGPNPKNSMDAFMGFYTFVPGYGWIVSGTYFLIDTTIGWDNAIKSFIETTKGYREASGGDQLIPLLFK